MSINILNNKYYYYNIPIGFGSFSTIFKGADYSDDKEIAVKKINKIIDKRHFNNEINLMKSLSHDNILKLHEVVRKTQKEIYFILEYCEGGDLNDYISSGDTEFDNKYYYEILEALEYLYKNDILHRDIKPQNILIHENSIKISDFGFAKTFEKNELITTFCGSPLYMAPEIILNKKYNYTSDIWSLGVVLYQLLTKQHPYQCDSREILWKKMKAQELKIDFEVINSINKKTIIASLLKFNDKQRITWEELFNKIKHYRDRSVSFDRSFFATKNVTKSLCIPKKPKNNLTHSTHVQNNLTIVNYDDCEVISNSAPNRLGIYYMNKYINNTSNNGDNIHILGNHIPRNNSYVFTNYLTKSISTLKGFFSN
tara:strand:+ start:1949 stop:3055 length:1107 start_codon:yes stop_codon:yes gene_type:complete